MAISETLILNKQQAPIYFTSLQLISDLWTCKSP